MSRFRLAIPAIVLLFALVFSVVPLEAGLQNFLLVNETGFTVYELYFSESANNSWGQDMLGEYVLENGESFKGRIQGSDYCYWDIMVLDEYETSYYWTEIDLCEVATIYLFCDEDGCWAEFE